MNYNLNEGIQPASIKIPISKRSFSCDWIFLETFHENAKEGVVRIWEGGVFIFLKLIT